MKFKFTFLISGGYTNPKTQVKMSQCYIFFLFCPFFGDWDVLFLSVFDSQGKIPFSNLFILNYLYMHLFVCSVISAKPQSPKLPLRQSRLNSFVEVTADGLTSETKKTGKRSGHLELQWNEDLTLWGYPTDNMHTWSQTSVQSASSPINLSIIRAFTFFACTHFYYCTCVFKAYCRKTQHSIS